MTERLQCLVCGGTLRPGTTDYCYTGDGRTFLFENVPAYICGQCGERTFSGPVFDAIEHIVREGGAASRVTSVGVYDLASAPHAVAAPVRSA